MPVSSRIPLRKVDQQRAGLADGGVFGLRLAEGADDFEPVVRLEFRPGLRWRSRSGLGESGGGAAVHTVTCNSMQTNGLKPATAGALVRSVHGLPTGPNVFGRAGSAV